ncbi:MAG TPA: phosphatase PAP2 family protein [Solirubrobacteraceae bacterium]|nr:phosphatase PAP2 family protein [Solirubrobacteraceae bacterium]
MSEALSAPAYPTQALPRNRSAAPRPPVGSVRAPLLVAALLVLAMAIVWLVATHVESARVRDAELLHRFWIAGGDRTNEVARALVHMINPIQFTIWAVAIVLFALARARYRLALVIAVVLLLAPFSADVIKPLLGAPHVGFGQTIGPGSWPSGHATAATVLALSAALVTPRRWRPLAYVLAGLFMLAIGVALLVRLWHMPSDVLGGWLLGSLWITLAVAVLRAWEQRRPTAPAH